jgi:hypothetical protein
MGSKTLFAALDLGIFEIVAAQPATLEHLAEKTGVAANRLGTLPSALMALGLDD